MKRLVVMGPLVLALVALLITETSVRSQQSQLRERMRDTPTPAMLEGLASDSTARPNIDPDPDQQLAASPWAFDADTDAYYRRGELLVKFDDGVDSTTRMLALRNADADSVLRVLPERWELVQVRERVRDQEALETLRDDPAVDDASLNYRLGAFQRRPNDEFYRLQWNFDAILLPQAWDINPGASSSVIVAVIDTGLNIVTDTFTFFSPFGQFPVRFATVPDLVTATNIVRPYDFVYRDAFPVDLGGHGTHVAGTVAQTTNNNDGVAGVAYNVRLMPLKVLSGGSFGSWDDVFVPGNRSGSADIVAEAIRYAADNGASVINLSLGGPGAVPIVRDAIRYAVGRGAFVAIAAGNSGDRGNPREYPAAYASEIEGAVAVGAVNRELRRAGYSGFQPYVEVCAPGGENRFEHDFERGITQVAYDQGQTLSFLTTFQQLAALRLGLRPRFDRFVVDALQGTSMATPHVSGVAALLYSQGIRDPGAIEQAVKLFARPIAAREDECGAGLIDPRRALRGLGVAR